VSDKAGPTLGASAPHVPMVYQDPVPFDMCKNVGKQFQAVGTKMYQGLQHCTSMLKPLLRFAEVFERKL
jgi:hypothetical protein